MLAIETVPTPDGTIQLEGKEDLKDRLGVSPDHLDALVLSFARPVQRKALPGGPPANRHAVASDYKPHARLGRR
jgi:hypothetical protein